VEYVAWLRARRRCHDQGSKHYKDYGGRGIQMCKRWRKSFAAFLEDMGKRPDGAMSLDRIDNNKGYTPSNVRWATQVQQMRNTRRNRRFSREGETKSLVEWCEDLNLDYLTVLSRLHRGCNEDRLFRPTKRPYTPRHKG